MISGARVRATLVAVLMVASFAGAAAWRPTTKLADARPMVNLETLFPKSFGGWSVDDRMPVQLVSPDTAALLGKIYSQTLSRIYVNAKGERIMLSVAYGGDQSDATRAHRPEVCYPAQGFQILSDSLASLSVGQYAIPVRRLLAKQGGRVEPITYWVVVGERVARGGTEQKIAQLHYSMRGLIPDGMLLRVSTIDADAAKAYQVQAGFVADLAAGVPTQFRSRVIGLASGD